MVDLVSVASHPSNIDRTATLVSTGPWTGRDIYRVRGGYIALMDDQCFPGLFASKEDAEAAQREFMKGRE